MIAETKWIQVKITKIVLLIVFSCVQLRAQHPEDFLSRTLGEDWLLENKVEKIEAKIRWANEKGKLRGRFRTDYIYDKTGEFYHPDFPKNVTVTRTDTSEVRCTIPNQGMEFCSTKVYRNKKLHRIEDDRGVSYLKYDKDGRLIGVWLDNNFNYDNGRDHVMIYEYDLTGRLVLEKEYHLRCYKSGDYFDEYQSFEVQRVVLSKLSYSEGGNLDNVQLFKGENEAKLEAYRALRYRYDNRGFPSSTEYFDVNNGQEVLLFIVKYLYKLS